MLQLSENPTTDTAAKLVVVTVAMFAFVFVVMVPLYDVLCDALGINGKTSGEAYTAVDVKVDTSREIKVQFVASNNAGMPWEFGPTVKLMRVNPGAVNDTVFFASNPTDEAMVAQTIPSISPARAAEYFHKTECFCFTAQEFAPEEGRDMGLTFMIDPDLPRHIERVTLAYTFFINQQVAAN